MKTLWKKTIPLSEEEYLEILKNSSPEQVRDMLDRAIAWGEKKGMEAACKAVCTLCDDGVPLRPNELGNPVQWVHWTKTLCIAFHIRERYARKTSE